VAITESEYLTAIYGFSYFGPARTKLLLGYFKKAKMIWGATASELSDIGLKPDVVQKFIKYKNEFDIQEYFERLKKLSIDVTTIFDNNYPQNLKGLADAPAVLYVRGLLKKSDSQAVAIVGTRMMTSYGREVANRFAGELANYGITVISGLALGIDAEAQRSALSAGGRTVGVLASGLDIVTPVTNRKLAFEFIKRNGALVSEYPLGHTPMPFEFPVRDRLISGLAKAVIVIEGRMRSGTFHTVKSAADQGRPVFAVPGQINSPTSEAPNYLIQNGAKLITKIKDVLEELDMQIKVDREVMEKVLPGSKDEEKIIGILESEPLHLDELVRISGLETSEISARLTIMEMKGMVRSMGNGIYRKCN
jgi:DNA processing protein